MHPDGGGLPTKDGPSGSGARDTGAATERKLSFEELIAQQEGGDESDGMPTGGDGVGSEDLDDLLAMMTGEQPITPEDELQQQLQVLLDAIADGADADRGAAPEGQSPAPVVPATAPGLFDSLGPAKVSAAVKDSVDCGILQHIIARGGLGLDAAHVGPVVQSIKKCYLDGGHLGGVHGEIVQAMKADHPSLAGLGQLVRDENLVIPLPQASAVLCFQNTYPAFWLNLRGKVGIKFNSHLADDRGGGLFDSRMKMIYLSSLTLTPPGSFIRLLVHEMGHAAFEAILLDGKAIPYELDEDAVSAMKGDSLTLGKEIQKVYSYWDGLPAPAKTFYHAWLTLRRDSGCHLLGLDLWQDPCRHRLSPDQRQRYQANNFSEFCAEMFMLFAMGDLHSHVVTILNTHDIGPNVKIARRNAWAVLIEVALPILHGQI